MNDSESGPPHFLRVARALARVRGAAIPLAAITTVVAGVNCSVDMGVVGFATSSGSGGGAGSSSATGTTTSSSTSATAGSSGGFYVMDGGYDGSAVGDMSMPPDGGDAGTGDAGH